MEQLEPEGTHGRHESPTEQPKGHMSRGGRITKCLGLQEIYTTNTWPGGDHVPQENQTMHGSSYIVHLRSNDSNYF